MSQTLPIEFHLGPAKTGLTCEIRVLQMDGTTEVSTWTATGVSEIDATNTPGSYRAINIVADDAGGFVEFRNQSGSVLLESTPIDPAPPTVTQITADMDANSTQLTAIVADTNELQADWANAGRLDTILDATATQASVDTVDSNVDAILLDTGTDGVVVASHTTAAKAEINAEADTALSDYDPPTNAELTTAQGVITAAITALNDLSAAEVNTEVDTALSDYDAPTNAEMTTAFTEIKGATWSSATDTLEAIRDRGDSAWATAVGFSTHAASDVWAIATATLTTAGTIGKLLVDNIDAVLSTLSTVTTAQVNAEVDTALADYDGPTNAELTTAQGVITDAITALNDLSAAQVNTEVDTALADYDGPTNAELTTAQGVITDAITALNDLSAAQVNAEVDTALADYDGPTNAELTTAQTAITDAIAALNDLSAAQVNAEVLDVLTVDTFAEVSGVPAATSTLKDKINWLFALSRNKITQSATTQTLRDDADGSDVATNTVGDTGSVFTRGEWS